MTEQIKGWKMVINSPKAHYFLDGRSFCGRWMNLGHDGFEDFNHHLVDNCKQCMKKRDKIAKARGWDNE